MFFRIILMGLFFFPCMTLAQTISGISDSLEHGSSVGILGAGFGSKSQVAPVTWDDMENVAFSPKWQSTGGLSVVEGSRHENSVFCGTLNMAGNEGEGGNHAYFTGDNGTLGERWYAQFWFKLDENFDWGTSVYGGGDQNLANVKVFRMWNPGSVNENFHINVHGYSSSGLIQYNSEYISDAGGGSFGNHYEWTKGEWHCLQVEFQDSSVGENDGILRVWRDGVLKVEDTDLMTREDYSQLKRPFILGFYDAWNDSGSDRDDIYLDDAYIDNSWARVEIGDAPIYGDCSHREIQIPEQWEDDSITVKVNMGSFSGLEDLYLFVVDTDGQVSEGFQITDINERPGVPIQPIFVD